MKRVRYVGPRPELKHKTALMDNEGKVQFDDITSIYSHGWYVFGEGDFEELPHTDWG